MQLARKLGLRLGGDAPVQGPFGHIASMRRTFMMLAAALCVFVMAGGGGCPRARTVTMATL
ncbi:hypothetical protein I0600191H4_21020 [Collinsella sp. i06-0019-1H4]